MRKIRNFSPLTKQEVLKIQKSRKTGKFFISPNQEDLKVKKTILIMLLFNMLLLSITLVYAHGNFNETKKLIDSGISCDKLTNEQLESIGDYYMEQMHPGEAHEYMDRMMGGEGSDSLKQMHINMAKTIYCNENVSSYGMMGGNMRSMMYGSYGSGMMGSSNFGYWNFLNILYLILLIGIIVLIILWIIKLIKHEGKRK